MYEYLAANSNTIGTVEYRNQEIVSYICSGVYIGIWFVCFLNKFGRLGRRILFFSPYLPSNVIQVALTSRSGIATLAAAAPTDTGAASSSADVGEQDGGLTEDESDVHSSDDEEDE